MMAIRPDLLTYQNHLGETIDFGRFGLYLDKNTFHDYSWDVKYQGKRISRFSRKSRQIKFDFLAASPLYFIPQRDIRSEIFNVTEKDVLAKEYGKLIIGDYYLKCYTVASEKYTCEHNRSLMGYSLTVETDFPFWISERTTQFRKTETADEENLDYPYDYPYDYYSGGSSQRIVNSFFAPVDFRLTIFGAVNNPAIVIGGHTYRVNTTVQAGEYLTIDSAEKTIVLTQNNGTKINKFDNRDRASYIFEPIPSGASPVTWLGDFAFDLTLIEKGVSRHGLDIYRCREA